VALVGLYYQVDLVDLVGPVLYLLFRLDLVVLVDLYYQVGLVDLVDLVDLLVLRPK
jgi:hypothetical protein